jgi:nucleoid DNA-binding protein
MVDGNGYINKWRFKMTGKELVKKISDETGYKEEAIKEVVSTLFEVISKEMLEGNEIKIPRFGNFIAKTFKSRNIFHPKTEELIKVPDRKLPKFEAGPYLKKQFTNN